MDIGGLSPRSAADKGAALHLKDPATKELLWDGKKPVTITVRGVESDAVRDKRKELDRRKLDGEDISEAISGAEVLAAMTVDWQCIDYDGEPLSCTTENARMLYLDPRTEWIVEQISPFARDRRNYVKNRKKT